MIRLMKSTTKVVVVVAVEAVVIIYMSTTSGFRWCDIPPHFPFVNGGSGVTAVALSSCKWGGHSSGVITYCLVVEPGACCPFSDKEVRYTDRLLIAVLYRRARQTTVHSKLCLCGLSTATTSFDSSVAQPCGW